MTRSFIENVNKLAAKLEIIIQTNSIFDEVVIQILEDIAALDLDNAVADLKKGTFLGNRKLDIDLALNKVGIETTNSITDNLAVWNDATTTVYYDKATVTFVDGVVIEVPFVNDDAQGITISNHGSLVSQLLTNAAFTAKLTNTGLFDDVGGSTGNLVRIYDITGASSNVERIVLNAVTGSYKEQTPIYYWGKTTSSFQTLAMRASDIIKLGDSINKIIVLANRIDEMLDLQSHLPELVTNTDSLYTHIAKLVTLHTNITAIVTVYTNIAKVSTVEANIANISSIVSNIVPNMTAVLNAATNAGIASTKATEASNSASAALVSKNAAATSAQTATDKANLIMAVQVGTVSTLAAGQSATVSYNPLTGKFSFGIPQGIKGDKGDAFQVNAQGVFAIRSLFDTQRKNFSFVATDTGTLYFKNSDTSGDWSLGIPFGKGDKGDTGDTGNGIVDIVFSSSTDASNLPAQSGATDTYTVTFTDTTTTTFYVYNGLDTDIHLSDLTALSDAITLALADKADKATTYTKAEVDTLLGDVVSSPAITTVAPSGVSSSTMTLNGSVESFGMTDMDALSIGFEYKPTAGSTWTATTPVAKSTLGAFSANISGLSTLTSYDIRAVAYDALNPTLVSYGSIITHSTTANDIPTDPTNTGSFPATLNKSSTTQFTFSGATDTDGTVTHYLVEQISSANLTVTTAEVAAGSAHTFNVGAISADEAVSFVVKAKDDTGAYSAGATVNVTLKNYIGIGTAGAMDFGVAPSFGPYAAMGLSDMTGTTTPGHDNWGNYQHTNGSIMVHIPKFYYRIGNAAAPQYATYGANSIEIAGADVYADEASANAAGFVLHRAFIDGGAVKSGFFIDKYLNSKKATDANVAVSVKNGNPIGLTTSTTYSTPSSTMPGCTGILADAVVLSRARGAGYNTASVFMYGALAILSIAHGQRATSTTPCAWYDAARTTNFPKGCNNNALADVNDTSVTWTGNGVNAAVGLTGSASNFAKSTHNGQNSGIADLNGLFYEPALGLTNIGTSATSTTQITTNTIYLLKQSAALSSLTAGWDGATDAWGNTTNLSTRYDAVTSPITVSASATEYWGSGTNQVFDPALSGVGRDLCGVLPKNDAADDATGTNMCGNDYMRHYNVQNMFPLFGGGWGHSAGAGVLFRYLTSSRSDGYNYASFRVAAYVS